MSTPSINKSPSTDQSLLMTLNRLSEVCHNAHDGYMEAANGINSAAYRTMFAEYALQRRRFASQIDTIINELGGEPYEDGVQDAWRGIRAVLMGGDHGAIFTECEESEDAAIAEYTDALKNDFPSAVHDVVHQQYQQIVEAHERIRKLRDAYREKNKNEG